jgi:hypothetical protein
VQLTQDYELGAVCHPWQDAPDYERASGFRVGDQVLAVGVAGPTGLTAREMSCGDRTAWLRRVKEQAEAARVLGPAFTLLGLVLLFGTGWLVRRSVGARRR